MARPSVGSIRGSLREILAKPIIVRPASVFDPLSCRMAASQGFSAIQLAGSVAANVVLGAPDLMLLSVSEFADLCRRLTRGCDLPLIVDADHGYGNALVAARCVEELEAAGVAALTIEDTLLPARYGSTGGNIQGSAGGFEFTTLEEHVGKLRSAIAARREGILIFARTSSFTPGTDASLADVCERLRAYSAVPGLDGVHVLGKFKPESLEKIQEAAGGLPIMISGAQGISDEDLAKHGVRLALSPHTPFLASQQAALEAFKASAAGGMAPPVIQSEDLASFLGVKQYQEAQKEYLKIEKPATGMK